MKARLAVRRDRDTELRLLKAARYEVIPTASIAAKVIDVVPRDVPMTVTASPAKGLEPTLDLTETLATEGYHVVPHLAARLLRGPDHLAEVVERMTSVGVTEVFMPAGDADPPAGPWDAAVPALRALTALGSSITEIGVTGYPEAHPTIGDDVAVQAMWDKRIDATLIVSNMCFDPDTVTAWVKRVRARGITLPIRIGLAGPVDTTKLLTMATKIGVGESTRFLSKHKNVAARLMNPGYSPERLVQRVASGLEPQMEVCGLHIFTFNQVAETEAWRQNLLAEF